MTDIVERLRDASDGWSGDAVCVSQEVAEAGAKEIELLRIAVEQLRTWQAIDANLSAYIETVRSDLIDRCVAEAVRCDTHELFCMADPAAIRRDIANRIRKLSSTVSPHESSGGNAG